MAVSISTDATRGLRSRRPRAAKNLRQKSAKEDALMDARSGSGSILRGLKLRCLTLAPHHGRSQSSVPFRRLG
eukprot:6468144-Amphidinium_carterae.1